MNQRPSRRNFFKIVGTMLFAPLLPLLRPLSEVVATASNSVLIPSLLQSINVRVKVPWSRYHDPVDTFVVPEAPKILYPSSLADLIGICSSQTSGSYLKAVGSHWALSTAAVSDEVFIETNDPNDPYPSLGRTLYDVVPSCLTRELLHWLGEQNPRPFDQNHDGINEGTYLVHVEAGKRIYQLYSELDLGEHDNVRSLAHAIERDYGNTSYRGSWAPMTLGGAAGQTIVGAISTGTHGGDFNANVPEEKVSFPPIADSVLAIHLVADGGKHYWIEPKTSILGQQLTDDDALIALYGTDEYRGQQPPGNGSDNFEIIRDDEIFNSVLVSVGRFGIIYSIVLKAVRQYSLHQERRLTTWQKIKCDVTDTSSELYSARFLQIAVCLTRHNGWSSNLCGVTKRWNVPMAVNPRTLAPIGRDERRGAVQLGYNPNVDTPIFERAGNSLPFKPDPQNPNRSPSGFEQYCSAPDLWLQVIDEFEKELVELLENDRILTSSAIAKVSVISRDESGLMELREALRMILDILRELARDIAEKLPRLGEAIEYVRWGLLGLPTSMRPAGLFVWQCLMYKLFSSEQADLDFEAISYAVMDGHNYFDQRCLRPGYSIEVFFDATDSMLVSFIDALIEYETKQEIFSGKVFAGYVSLRFTGPTRALIGMQRFPITCAVEIGGLSDVEGSKDLIDYALTLCRNKNFNGILHWGQGNTSTREDIEHRFGPSLWAWRRALWRINGAHYRFSSQFTRATGLEIN